MGYTGKIAAFFILLQPISGLLFLLRVRSVNESIFNKIVTGNVSRFFWPMVILGSLAVIFSLVFLLSKKRISSVLLIGGLAVYIAFPFGGFTRERARKPYLIYGYMYLNQRLVPREDAENLGIADKNLRVVNGDSTLEEYGCLACHNFRGKGGTFGPNLNNLNYKKEDLEKIIKSPPKDMPPFEGDEKDLERIVEVLLRAQ
ncbi:MAG: c-type cytochrome [Acidobacteriota bacterium]